MKYKIEYILLSSLLSYSGMAFSWVLNEEDIIKNVNIELKVQPEHVEEKTNTTESPTIIEKKEIALLEKKSKITKKISPPTKEEEANKAYNRFIEKIETLSEKEKEKDLVHILSLDNSHCLARIQLAKLALDQQNPAKAEAYLHGVSEKNRLNPIYLQHLSEVYASLGQKEKALEVLEKLPDEAKEQINIKAALAALYYKVGRHDLSQKYYQALLSVDPENPNWILGLSVVFDATGKKSLALKGYQKLYLHSTLPKNIQDFIQKRVSTLSSEQRI